MPAIARGSLVRVEILGVDGILKRRPAVVISITTSGFEVVYGQGDAYKRCSCPVAVRQGSSMGTDMELIKDTHFSAWAAVPATAIVKVFRGQCPVRLLPQMDAVALEARQWVRASRPHAPLQQASSLPTLSVSPASTQPIPRSPTPTPTAPVSTTKPKGTSN